MYSTKVILACLISKLCLRNNDAGKNGAFTAESNFYIPNLKDVIIPAGMFCSGPLVVAVSL